MRSGYIKLWRFSAESADYFLEPFTRWQAWIDLLLMANYKEARVCVRGIMVTVGRGQVLASEDYLADRWKWSRGKVRRYLAYLSSETVQQIVQQKNNVVGVISIVNWEKYQVNTGEDDTTNGTANGTTDGQQIVQQTVHTKEEYKKNKNNKKIVDSTFLNSMKPLFPSVNVDLEWEHCQVWCVEHNKKPSPSRLMNWLKRVKPKEPVSEDPWPVR